MKTTERICPCENVTKEGGTCQCCQPEAIQATKDFYEKKALSELTSRDHASCEDDSIES